MIEIEVHEIVQAGDYFLLHFDCPQCQSANFTSYPVDGCQSCSCTWAEAALVLPGHRKDFRLLAGTARKKYFRFHKKTIRMLMEIQGECCAYCDRSIAFGTYHIDHVVPVCVGGSNQANNLVLSCPECNLVGGSKAFRGGYPAKRAYIRERVRQRRGQVDHCDGPVGAGKIS